MLQFDTIDNHIVGKIECSDLDAENSEAFLHEIAPYLTAHTSVILDLAELNFIDSSGLGAVLSCKRKLQAGGSTLKLCGLSATVRDIFDLVRLSKVFEIYATREEAMMGRK